MSDFRQTGYPIATVNTARELYAAGWKPAAIQRILEIEGHPVPSRTAIYEWVDPGYREMQRSQNAARAREKSAAAAKFRLPSDTPAYRMAFIQRLRSEGLSCSAIAKVHGVVFGDPLTHHQVRYALRQEATGC